MSDGSLAGHHAVERAGAIRELLATPILNVATDPDRFGLTVRHHEWLASWFDTTCGWQLTVDIGAGFARLAKRSACLDPTRPLRRLRGDKKPFDRRRLQLLCLICAELVRRPVTTIGLLAQAIPPDAQFDTSRRMDRVAFVDSLLALGQWGVIRATAGSVDAFIEDERGNAILTADTPRLHRLLVSSNAPSGLADATSLDQAAEALLAEPRYGEAARDPGTVSDEQRLLWTRHSLARRVLDDPVTLLADLSPAEQDYLAHPSGRRWLRDRVAEAGFELEERAEGIIAVDPEAIATDLQFPSPQGNAYQLALLLIDRLVTKGASGRRTVGSLSATALLHAVNEVLADHPGWARAYREEGGPAILLAEAVDLLVSFGLVRREEDESVVGRPVLARYRIGEPITTPSPPSLLEEDA
ncbi:MAG TPA: TIGR02678 family protein [Acidimicrobiales bacterium]|nr:TIGR02678 family protein [Acidimicrobiales bacterium]